MAKAKFERTKPHCNIGTIGHFDKPYFYLSFENIVILQPSVRKSFRFS